jgi:uncharacterized protein YjbI with pentapeptide repeats
MKTYTTAELNKILKKHSDWYCGKPGGCRADLRDADLCRANLRDADLCGANLCGANLRDADLCRANLRDANLCGANLCGANLRDANLCGANLCGANLRDANLCRANLLDADLCRANLCRADLCRADLCGANLRDADLCRANLRDADLRDAKNINLTTWNIYTSFYPIQCPESGSFIGWKKAKGKIVKLEICKDALRSSATSRKCRCSSAKVLAIENIDGTPYGEIISSDYDENFIYKVGEVVGVLNFDTNRWNECAPGIHFFITRDEAVKY